MDFEKSNLVPKSNILDFDLNEPCMEESDLDTEDECSQLIHMNTDSQKDTEVDCALDMNMNMPGGDNEVHQSSAAVAGSVVVANDSAVVVGAFDDNARHLQTKIYVTSICCGPDGTARGRDLHGGRRRPRCRAGSALMQSDPHKYCTNYYCRTRKTPMWRKGPLGPKTLCNACGIDYVKQVTKRGSGVTTFPDATLVPATIDDDASPSTAVPAEGE